jgi:hypothetical protein
MKLILHIGQSKTGTTALQSMLSRNRNVLKEHRVLYPDNFLKGMALNTLNQNAFANSINGYDLYEHLSADQHWDQFLDQFQSGNYDCMLLSGESFYAGRPYPWETDNYYDDYRNKLIKLKSYIDRDNWEVEIIAYLRSQNEWLESAIPHIIRYQGTLKEQVYKNDPQLVDILAPIIDYERIIGLWDKIISPQKIHLPEYDRSAFTENNIALDFLEHIDLQDKRLEKTNTADNPHDSWSRSFIEIKKELNLTQKSRMKEEAIIDIINSLNKQNKNQEKYALSTELHAEILEHFKAGNANISKKYNGNTPIFSKARLDKVRVKEYREFTADEHSQTMAFYNKYRKSPTGWRLFIRSCIKRILRKKTPFIYHLCTKCVKTLKERKTVKVLS